VLAARAREPSGGAMGSVGDECWGEEEGPEGETQRADQWIGGQEAIFAIRGDKSGPMPRDL